MINADVTDQCCLGATVIFPARKQGMRMRRWKQLQCTLAAGFLVASAKLMKSFPRGRLDDRHRNLEQLDSCFEGATTSTEFETRRCTLPRHRLTALDHGMVRPVLLNQAAQRQNVDALFRFDADDGKVDRVKELRCDAVADLDDGASALTAPGSTPKALTSRLHQVTADKIAPELMGGMHYGEAASGGIDDEVAGVGDGADQSSD